MQAERFSSWGDHQKMIARLIEIILATIVELGITWAIVICGFAGSCLSLMSIDPSTVTLRTRITTVAAGLALSWFGTPALASYWEITHVPIISGVALLLGLFGIVIVKEIFDFIKSGGLKSFIPSFLRPKGTDK